MQVGIWIRVSTEEQAQGESPKNHETRARMYAELKNWNVVELYDLSGVSGKSVIDHPEAKRMLNDVASGKIQALIFSKLARLARNVRELLEISDHFQKHNANLVSLEESIDTSTPAGRLLFTVIGALAQWEREEISARVAASVPVRAKMGKPTGGRGPFGYTWNDKHLAINPDEALVVKEIYNTFLETKKLLTTARVINDKGYRSRNGALFGKTTIKRILTNPTYKGMKRANYSKSKGNKKSWVLKPQSEWVYFEVEPIIPEDTWNEVNAIIKGWSGRYPKSVPKESRFPFGGLLVCECGGKMYVYPYEGMKVNRYVCRNCRNKINEDVIIEQFLEGLKTMVLKPEQLEGRSNSEIEIKEKQERLRLLQKELQTTNNKIDKLLDLWNSEAIDKQTFSERFSELKERKEQILLEIPRLQAEIDFIKVSELGRDYLLTQAKTFASMWPLLNEDERNRFIKEVIESIKVGKDTLTFTFFYQPEFMPLENCVHTHRGSWQQRA
jgi:site-specific DNA recombinase